MSEKKQGGSAMDTRALRDAFRTAVEREQWLQEAALDVEPVLTSPQARILSALAELGSASQRKLFDALRIDSAWLSRNVAALRKAGLVEIDGTPGSPRNVPLRLTSRGRERAKRYQADIDASWRRVLAELPPAERRELTHALPAFVASLERVGAQQSSKARARLDRITQVMGLARR